MITVMFFGPVAERVGSREVKVGFHPGIRVQDVHAQLQALYPAAFEIVCFTAVNGRQTRDMSSTLADNSEMAFMARFSGG